MKVSISRAGDYIEVKKITITQGDVDFLISENKFGELVINKCIYGDGESSIFITPCVSNEIIIK